MENNWVHTFPKGISLCEMQSISSKIWTRVIVSISSDDDHYTTGTSLFEYYKAKTLDQN